MAQQTAVDWLIKKLSTELIGEIRLHRWEEMRDAVQQAKQMEKEQMKNMWRGGQWSVELGGEFEQYYNETYGTTK